MEGGSPPVSHNYLAGNLWQIPPVGPPMRWVT